MRLSPSNTTIIQRLLVGRASRPLRSILTKADPADVAGLIPRLTPAEQAILFDALADINRAGAVLLQLSEPLIRETIQNLSTEDAVKVIRSCSAEDIARVLGSLDDSDQAPFLDALPAAQRQLVEKFLNYPEDSAGRVMQTDVFALQSQMTGESALDELRRRAQIESIYYVYCTDESGVLEGVVSLRQLVTCAPKTPLSSLMRRDLVMVQTDDPATEAAQLVSKYGLIAIPVVDANRKFMGIITVDDIVDLITDQATAEVYAQAGLQEDDRVFTPAMTSVKKRLPWMMVNLGLATVASSVVALFEETMSMVIVLASLKNIVAGVAGNTAIQSLTVVTRGIAIGDFKIVGLRKAVIKEFTVGCVVGVATGLAAGIVTYVWKENIMVSVVITISMFLNALVAAAFGCTVPLALLKFKLDPATGSGPIVTMVSDIFSFFSFLGIASLGLKYFA